MSELRSVVEALRAETLPELPDARIEEEFTELQRSLELLEAERLRRLAEIDRRRLFERDGHLSAASWLAVRHRMAWGTARYQVRVGRALEEMPQARAALDAGEVSLAAVRLLATAHGVDREAFARSEGELVDAARRHSIQDLNKVVGFWRERAEHERSPDREDSLRSRRAFHASVSFLGMVRVDGELDPEAGETLLSALGAVQGAETRSRRFDDDRTPAQRRADALGEICRQWLDASDRPMVGGERPHLTVTVAAESLGGGVSGAGEMDHVGPVPREVARRVACDAAVMRVVMSGRSEPLDVGRRTALISPALRRALIVRDGHCRFPGCDRPQTWCDGHHVVHWADGGPTSLENLLLLCRRHHRMIHRPGGFRLEIEDGQPVFRRPDGSPLEDQAPP
ncbi:MAG: DUF222 domain-containing protein [Actinobacteria bacterium]|nr:DUF222 domain-containing protein [Actinomycetota bacterium]